MSTVTTKPLQRGQQILLQRLLASHVMEDGVAQELFSQLRGADGGGSDDENNDGNVVDNDINNITSLDVWFAEINQELTKGFGLEIATVVLNKTRYHSILNSHADDVAKQSFSDRHWNAHERALVRLILQELVNHKSGGDGGGGGEEGGLPRKDLINLRGDLEEPFKLTLAGAEHVVEMLLEEAWIRVVEGDTRRRESMKVTLELAPRTYLELSHTLLDYGMPQDGMPQFLFHRI